MPPIQDKMTFILKSALKRLAVALLGNYSAYYIYASTKTGDAAMRVERHGPFVVRPVDRNEIAQAEDPIIRQQANYAGPGAYSFGCFLGDRLVGLCFYWYGPRYSLRDFWPLGEHEAKLVQIITLPEVRNRGVAKQLIVESLDVVTQREGLHRAFARIWHSNTSSLRAFEHARWQRTALVVEINPLRRAKPMRLQLNSALFGCRPLTLEKAPGGASATIGRPDPLHHGLHGTGGDAPSGRS